MARVETCIEEEEVINKLFKEISLRTNTLTIFKEKYKLDTDLLKPSIEISTSDLSDMIDEFDFLISLSTQAIRTLQTQFANLRETSHMSNFEAEQIKLPNTESNDLANTYALSPKNEEMITFNPSQAKDSYEEKLEFHYANLVNAGNESNVVDPMQYNFNEIDDSRADKENSSTLNVKHGLRRKIRSAKNSRLNSACNDSPRKIDTHCNEENLFREDEPQLPREKFSLENHHTLESEFNDNHHYIVSKRGSSFSERLNAKEDNLDKIMASINPISQNYFARKYGNGSYENFVIRLKSFGINLNVLENEVGIINDMLNEDKQLSRNSNRTKHMTHSKNGISDRRRSKSSRSKSPVQTVPYVEPVNFADYLRKPGIRTAVKEEIVYRRKIKSPRYNIGSNRKK